MNSRKFRNPGIKGAMIGCILGMPIGYVLAVASKIPGNYSNSPKPSAGEAISMMALCMVVCGGLGYGLNRGISYFGCHLFHKSLYGAAKSEMPKMISDGSHSPKP